MKKEKEIKKSIRNVVIKRLVRGARKKEILKYLDHLIEEIWKNSPEIQEYILELKNIIKEA